MFSLSQNVQQRNSTLENETICVPRNATNFAYPYGQPETYTTSVEAQYQGTFGQTSSLEAHHPQPSIPLIEQFMRNVNSSHPSAVTHDQYRHVSNRPIIPPLPHYPQAPHVGAPHALISVPSPPKIAPSTSLAPHPSRIASSSYVRPPSASTVNFYHNDIISGRYQPSLQDHYPSLFYHGLGMATNPQVVHNSMGGLFREEPRVVVDQMEEHRSVLNNQEKQGQLGKSAQYPSHRSNVTSPPEKTCGKRKPEMSVPDRPSLRGECRARNASHRSAQILDSASNANSSGALKNRFRECTRCLFWHSIYLTGATSEEVTQMRNCGWKFCHLEQALMTGVFPSSTVRLFGVCKRPNVVHSGGEKESTFPVPIIIAVVGSAQIRPEVIVKEQDDKVPKKLAMYKANLSWDHLRLDGVLGRPKGKQERMTLVRMGRESKVYQRSSIIPYMLHPDKLVCISEPEVRFHLELNVPEGRTVMQIELNYETENIHSYTKHILKQHGLQGDRQKEIIVKTAIEGAVREDKISRSKELTGFMEDIQRMGEDLKSNIRKLRIYKFYPSNIHPDFIKDGEVNKFFGFAHEIL